MKLSLELKAEEQYRDSILMTIPYLDKKNRMEYFSNLHKKMGETDDNRDAIIKEDRERLRNLLKQNYGKRST